MSDNDNRGGNSGKGSDDGASGRSNDRRTSTSGRDVIDLSSSSVRGSVLSYNGTEVLHRHGTRVENYGNAGELRFIDGRLVVDANDPAAQVMRLYKAALDRSPDQNGLNYWIDRLQGGGKLNELSESFLRSSEFEARYGRPDDTGYVDRLYQNVLSRPGDTGGKSYWVNQLKGGMDRRDVLASFAESNENKVATQGILAAGIWDRSEAAEQVARLYSTIMGRLPDASGLSYWHGKLDNGSAKLEDVAEAFSRSAEFTGRYGALNNRDFVEGLYRNTLGRSGDDNGVGYWSRQLDSNSQTRVVVATRFSESSEHVARTAPQYANEDPSRYGITLAS